MPLPLEPPIKPQLAKSAKKLPEGDQWRYEPKWDGFRTLAFKDGDEVYLQSRGGKPMNRYFPDVVEQVAAMPEERVVLDGEMVVEVDGVQEFDMLSQRIHPAESRVKMLAEQTPARYVAFDVLAVGDEVLTELGYDERRERLAKLKLGTVEESPSVRTTDEAGAVADRQLRGRRGQGGRGRRTCPASARAWSRSSACAPWTPWSPPSATARRRARWAP